MSILGLSFCFIWGATGLVLNVWRGAETMPQNILFAALAAVVGARSVAEGLAFLLRRHAAPALAAHGDVVDGIIIAALLVFAVATMAGIRAQIAADVPAQ